MSWTQEKVDSTLEALVKRATTDAAFRQLALSNPAEAVKAVAGEAPPAAFKLRLVENAGADMTVVLPDLELAGGELTDDDLERVAGGTGKGDILTRWSNRPSPTQPCSAC